MKFVKGALLNVTYSLFDAARCPSTFEVKHVVFGIDSTTTYECIEDCDVDMADFYVHYHHAALISYVDDLGRFEDYKRSLEE